MQLPLTKICIFSNLLLAAPLMAAEDQPQERKPNSSLQLSCSQLLYQLDPRVRERLEAEWKPSIELIDHLARVLHSDPRSQSPRVVQHLVDESAQVLRDLIEISPAAYPVAFQAWFYFRDLLVARAQLQDQKSEELSEIAFNAIEVLAKRFPMRTNLPGHMKKVLYELSAREGTSADFQVRAFQISRAILPVWTTSSASFDFEKISREIGIPQLPDSLSGLFTNFFFVLDSLPPQRQVEFLDQFTNDLQFFVYTNSQEIAAFEEALGREAKTPRLTRPAQVQQKLAEIQRFLPDFKQRSLEFSVRMLRSREILKASEETQFFMNLLTSMMNDQKLKTLAASHFVEHIETHQKPEQFLEMTLIPLRFFDARHQLSPTSEDHQAYRRLRGLAMTMLKSIERVHIDPLMEAIEPDQPLPLDLPFNHFAAHTFLMNLGNSPMPFGEFLRASISADRSVEISQRTPLWQEVSDYFWLRIALHSEAAELQAYGVRVLEKLYYLYWSFSEGETPASLTHVQGWASSVISPTHETLRAFRPEQVFAEALSIIFSGHPNARQRLYDYLHREQPFEIEEIVSADGEISLLRAAEREGEAFIEVLRLLSPPVLPFEPED